MATNLIVRNVDEDVALALKNLQLRMVEAPKRNIGKF